MSTSPASVKNVSPLLAPAAKTRLDLVAGHEPDDVEVVHAAVAEEPAAKSACTPRAAAPGRSSPRARCGSSRARPTRPRRAPGGSRRRSGAGSRCAPARALRASSSVSAMVRSRSSATGFSQKVGMSRDDGRLEQLGVGRGAGGDDEGVEARVEQGVDARGGADPQVGRDPFARARCRGRRARGRRRPASVVSVLAWKAPIRPVPARPMRMSCPSGRAARGGRWVELVGWRSGAVGARRGSTGRSGQVSRTQAWAGSSQISQARSAPGPAMTLR